MKRLIAALVIAVVQAPVSAAGSDPVAAAGAPVCESQSPGFEMLDVSCPLKASGKPQSFHFKALFTGGHDDTKATIEPTLNGQPLECEPGSKTSLFAENGDVSLDCKFSLKEKKGSPQVFKVAVVWTHCQYTDFEFGPD